MSTKLPNVIFPYLIGTFGGFLFYLSHLPLAWILGPMTFLIIWRSLFKKISTFIQPSFLKNGSFIILGISFGLSFTKETFVLVGPYVIPFLLTTVLLIFLSVCNGLIISKLVNIDRNTSIFASIPGGLTEMVAASEAVHANSSLVTIFQTVRLLSVVFLVPFTILHMFEPSFYSQTTLSVQNDLSLFSYSWYFFAGLAGWGFRKFLPASYVIGPLLTTALLNIIGIELPLFHDLFMIFAQISIGVGFGLMITFNDLKKGGKYCGLYFITTMILIVASFGFGYVFSLLTDLNLATAMLSLAPGGLVEMVLTASSIGADPAIVSSLQFIRLLFIISVVPGLLKYSINKLPSKSLN